MRLSMHPRTLIHRRLFVAGAAALSLSACAGEILGPPEAGPIYPVRPTFTPAAGGEKVNWALAVMRPDVPGGLDTDRIALLQPNGTQQPQQAPLLQTGKVQRGGQCRRVKSEQRPGTVLPDVTWRFGWVLGGHEAYFGRYTSIYEAYFQKYTSKNDQDPGNASNLAAIVGLPRVSFLIDTSCVSFFLNTHKHPSGTGLGPVAKGHGGRGPIASRAAQRGPADRSKRVNNARCCAIERQSQGLPPRR